MMNKPAADLKTKERNWINMRPPWLIAVRERLLENKSLNSSKCSGIGCDKKNCFSWCRNYFPSYCQSLSDSEWMTGYIGKYIEKITDAYNQWRRVMLTISLTSSCLLLRCLLKLMIISKEKLPDDLIIIVCASVLQEKQLPSSRNKTPYFHMHILFHMHISISAHYVEGRQIFQPCTIRNIY